MEAYVSTFKQCVTTDLIHSGLPQSQTGLQALTERTKHITSHHNIHAYVQNQICPLLHLLNTTSCHHCTYTQEISISSTLHHATTAHIHKKSPYPQHYIIPPLHIYTRNLHLLNTTSCHHCTYTLSPPPSPQHYIMPPLHMYTRNLHLLNTTSCHHCTCTQEISISSTLHHATTAHVHKKSPSPQHYIMPPLHIYTRNLHLLNTTSCHHCTYTQEISISSTLHHTTTAHIHKKSPSPHTTSCHHCTYTQEISISSTLHHATTAHIHKKSPSPQHYTSSQVYLSILPDACGPSALSVRD